MRVLSKKFTLAAAGGLTALAISTGAAAAYAQTTAASTQVTTAEQQPATAQSDRDGEEKLAKLADKLGVTTEELTEALKTVRDQETTTGETNKAKQLADALGMEESKVEQALLEVEDEDSEANRQLLETRLDKAVADGQLTEADKAAVLKAYDAGVLLPPLQNDQTSSSATSATTTSKETAAESISQSTAPNAEPTDADAEVTS